MDGPFAAVEIFSWYFIHCGFRGELPVVECGPGNSSGIERGLWVLCLFCGLEKSVCSEHDLG